MTWLRKIVKKYDWFFYLLVDVAILIGICLYVRLTDTGWCFIPLWFILNFAILNGLEAQYRKSWMDVHDEIFGGRPWYK